MKSRSQLLPEKRRGLDTAPHPLHSLFSFSSSINNSKSLEIGRTWTKLANYVPCALIPQGRTTVNNQPVLSRLLVASPSSVSPIHVSPPPRGLCSRTPMPASVFLPLLETKLLSSSSSRWGRGSQICISQTCSSRDIVQTGE